MAEVVDNGALADYTVATDKVGGVDYQRVKLVDSIVGSTTPTGVDTHPLVTAPPARNAVLLDAVTVIGPGSPVSIPEGCAIHAMQVTWTGSPDFLEVDLEGSVDRKSVV